jgi:glutathionylspermidine synthase
VVNIIFNSSTMIQKYRKAFNSNFTVAKYNQFMLKLEAGYPAIPFRVAETPIFIPEALKQKLIAAGEEIISLIKQDNFKQLTQKAIPTAWNVPNETAHPHFLTFDYGLCKDENGEVTPMLIEMQGFPSLYGFQTHLAKTYKEFYQLDESLSPYFNGLDENSYFELLKKVIIGEHQPHEVALMDIDAPNQKTAIDFFVTAKHLGIKILALEDISKEGKQLFYTENEQKTQLKRIYNRLIFDEIGENTDIFKNSFDPREELDIEWITHPNWFYRISKYTMPFLKSEFVPETRFLNTIESIPTDLENYVLKPLFSFAGMGVIIDVTETDITEITDPENWILQRKVTYEPVIEAPDAGVKAEIRMMYLWPEGEEPQLCVNLGRLSRGKMIGVRYNADFDWVGGSVGLMEKG